jgi:hypothetical protein
LCSALFTPYRSQPTKWQPVSELTFIKVVEMKALTWKAMLASLNPSPVFEALAGIAEELAMNGNGLDRNKSALTGREEYVPATSTNP